MATLNIQVKVNSADASQYSAASQPNRCVGNAAALLKGLAAGAQVGSVTTSVSTSDPVAASGTITLATVSADDTVTIGKTTLTAKASPSGEDQFSQAGTDTVDAAGLVTKINAHSVLGKLVFASSSAGVVTVTAHAKGSVGNHIALTSSNGTRLAVTGSGYLASGTGGAETAPNTYGR
jgi:phage tail sheath gpL-like